MTRSKRDGLLVYHTNNGNPVSKTGAHWVNITPPNQINKRTIHSIGSKGGLVVERRRSCGNQTAENQASIVNQIAENQASIVNQTQSHTVGNHTQVAYDQFPIRNQIGVNL